MAGEFKIKNGLVISGVLDAADSLPISGVSNDVATALASDVVTGDAIRDYISDSHSGWTLQYDGAPLNYGGSIGNILGFTDILADQYNWSASCVAKVTQTDPLGNDSVCIVAISVHNNGASNIAPDPAGAPIFAVEYQILTDSSDSFWNASTPLVIDAASGTVGTVDEHRVLITLNTNSNVYSNIKVESLDWTRFAPYVVGYDFVTKVQLNRSQIKPIDRSDWDINTEGIRGYVYNKPAGATTADQVTVDGSSAHVGDVQTVINHLWSATSLEGLALTYDAAASTIDISAGSCVLRNSNTNDSGLETFDIGAVSDMPIGDGLTEYVYVDYNGGSPVLATSPDFPTLISNYTFHIIHAVTKTAGQAEMGHIALLQQGVNFMQANNLKNALVNGLEKASGFALHVDAVTHKFDITAGNFYIQNLALSTSAFDTSASTTYKRIYGSTTLGWVRVYDQTVIDYANYNDITGGVPGLSAVASQKFGVHWLFCEFNDPSRVSILYGTESYSLQDALDANMPTDLPNEISAGTTGHGMWKMIIEDDGTVAELIDLYASTGGVAETPTVHNELSGLNQGDYQHLTSAEKSSAISAGDLPGETKDPTGFDTANYGTMQDTVSLSFVTGTSTFSIDPIGADYSYFYRGQRHTVTTTKSVTCPFATSRQWFIIFNDASGTLEAISTLANGAYTIIRDNVFVAEVVWNVAGTALIKASVETHGLMGWEEHLAKHSTDGTKFQNGLLVTPVNNTKEIGFESGTVWDEDIPWTTDAIAQSVSNSISVIWRAGDTWDGAKYPGGVKVDGSGRAEYNLDIGGDVWSTAVIDGSDFACVHYFATPDFDGNEIFAVVGQQTYDKAGDARNGASTELYQLKTAGLPFPEYKAIATAIVDGDTNANWTFEPTDGAAMIVDWRYSKTSTTLVATVTDHGSLNGLADDDHTQYFNTTRGDARYALDNDLSTHTLDATIHREINDAGTSTTQTWSSSKVNSDISSVAGDLTTHEGASNPHSISHTTLGAHTGDVTGTSALTISSLAVESSMIADNAVGNTKLTDVPTNTFKGRVAGGTGNPTDLTQAEATSMLNTFTSTLNGLTPLSGGGTTNYLRADGTWAEPASGGGMTNPMTTQGDVIYGGTSGAPTRLAKGTAAQVLTMNTGATAPEWTTPSSGGSGASTASFLYSADFTITNDAHLWSGPSYTDGITASSYNAFWAMPYNGKITHMIASCLAGTSNGANVGFQVLINGTVDSTVLGFNFGGGGASVTLGTPITFSAGDKISIKTGTSTWSLNNPKLTVLIEEV